MNARAYPRIADPTAIAVALQHGELVSDHRFDLLLAVPLRRRSATFWTPVAVAMVAARWFEHAGTCRVLDLGAGAGKLCAIGGLITGLRFHGVEHRGHLVHHARILAKRLGVAERVTFTHASLGGFDVRGYDGLYLYNPFGENVHPRGRWLDESVEVSLAKYLRDVNTIERALDELAVGTSVVTYHGFGGRLPDSFQLVRSRPLGNGRLRYWRKTREVGLGGYWIEDRELLVPAEPARRRP